MPWTAGRLGRTAGRRQAAARGELTAEIVDVLRAAPELVVYGAEGRVLERVRSADRELDRLARRDAFSGGVGDALSILVAGLTVAAVLAVSVRAHEAGSLDRVLVAMLALLALASFEAVGALPAAARELSTTLASGRRVLELIAREPAVRDPATPAAPPRDSAASLEDVTARYSPAEAPVLSALRPTARARRSCRARGSERLRQDDGDEPPAPLPRPRGGERDGSPAVICPEYRQEDVRATYRPRGPGGACLRLDHPRQPAARPPGRHRLRSLPRAPASAPRRVGGLAARGARHAGRRGRPTALRRPAATADDRARLAFGCPGPRPGRADGPPRSGDGTGGGRRRIRRRRRPQRPPDHSPARRARPGRRGRRARPYVKALTARATISPKSASATVD